MSFCRVEIIQTRVSWKRVNARCYNFEITLFCSIQLSGVGKFSSKRDFWSLERSRAGTPSLRTSFRFSIAVISHEGVFAEASRFDSIAPESLAAKSENIKFQIKSFELFNWIFPIIKLKFSHFSSVSELPADSCIAMSSHCD